MTEPVHARLSRIAQGDNRAIAWLFDRFSVRLRRRLRLRFGADPSLDPDDLLQDTYVFLIGNRARPLRRFLEGAADSVSESALERFLWSTACGIASNRRRSGRRHAAIPIQTIEATGPVFAVRGGESDALARDLLERLARCLRQRGPSHYLYFQLRYRGGLDPREIVEATGWSPKKTYKLKQALDQALDRCAEELGLEP